MSFELIEKLRDKGYKITRQRESILAVLSEEGHQLLSAREIFKKVLKNGGCTNFSTVYRNLELLMQEGIVRKVELNRDAACYELSNCEEHHHHLVCTKCGNIQVTSYCPLDELQDEDGFVPTEHHFEIYGYCKDCV
ncbi:MAG: Fur family transcriptional regulator [Caldicoprobacterales bacterium]|mgnify:CR=1 FL=1|jgi:Fe2+ or Zn2+ uptake regulation protein|nr:transcriptional repressor [Clostridiales bacterium]